jgi:hypothetical protein
MTKESRAKRADRLLDDNEAMLAGMLKAEGYDVARIARRLKATPGRVRQALDKLKARQTPPEPVSRACAACGVLCHPDEPCANCAWLVLLQEQEAWLDALLTPDQPATPLAPEPGKPAPVPARPAQGTTKPHRKRR